MLHFYVYAYLRNKDSITAKAGTPYYIGKGTGDRAWQQHRVVRNGRSVGILTPKETRRIVILEAKLTEVGAFALERRYIRWYGRKDAGSGILGNMTAGGEGATGSHPWARGVPKTATHRAKLSTALKGKPSPKTGYVKSRNYRASIPRGTKLSTIQLTNRPSTHGEKNPNAKLSPSDVIDIRKKLSESSGSSQKILRTELRDKYNISMSTIIAIAKFRIWKNLV